MSDKAANSTPVMSDKGKPPIPSRYSNSRGSQDLNEKPQSILKYDTPQAQGGDTSSYTKKVSFDNIEVALHGGKPDMNKLVD